MKKRFMVVFLGFVLLCIFLGTKLMTPTGETFSQIVREMGYEDVTETPYEVVEITIPQEFDAVYERYNALQKEGGYDLSIYKGKKCVRYTYLIPSQNARANILVYKGEIIGGDISGITLDGIMKPLSRRKIRAT